ncbi:MAG: sugar MFS transporter [Rhodospirillaceae bacterium]|nr:MAG: sugar MFS transporter [Rhodospirillaceae bacterium]
MTDAAAQRRASPQMPKIEKGMLYLVVFLFFAWGFSTVLLDSLIPKLKSLFALNYAEVMLTQFCFFLSYFLFSMPAAVVLSKIGYVKSIVLGLIVMATGCLLISPAAMTGIYPGFLIALFVMAAGITMLQVAANPFIAVLGPERDSSSRLTLAQAFNSLGTTIGPQIGAAFILSQSGPASVDTNGMSAPALAALRIQEAHDLQIPFIAIALTLVLVAAIFWQHRKADTAAAGAATGLRSSGRVLAKPRLAIGTLCIFVYVGAEVSIGSVMINYLMQGSVLGISAAQAGKLVSLYWGGAMIGRFVGSAVMRRIPPGLVLAGCAFGAATLATLSSTSVGMIAATAIIAVGLCNSIMFPTIFTLALEGLGEDKPTGSGILCMAIVGGAIIPEITGFAADAVGLSLALFIPAACYLVIATYGLLAWRGLGGVAHLPDRRESSLG